jgi:uncharacterized protein
MSHAVMDMTAKRMAEAGATTGVLHGGEPTLNGARSVVYFTDSLGALTEPRNRAWRIQTDGLSMVHDSVVHRLAGVYPLLRVGVSVDGTKSSHNEQRKLKNGEGSYDRVMAGLANLMRIRPELLRSLYCVINTRYSPEEMLDAMFEVARHPLDQPGKPWMFVDFLLPHGTHDLPPPKGNYAEWLLRLAQAYEATPGTPPPIRLLEEIKRMVRGACTSGSVLVGSPDSGLLVVSHEGKWQRYDAEQILGNQTADLEWLDRDDGQLGLKQGDSLTVHNASIAVAQQAVTRWNQTNGVGMRLTDGRPDLCATCMNCSHVRECAGGLPLWRDSQVDDSSRGLVKGRRNPHIYCDAYTAVIEFYKQRLGQEALRPACGALSFRHT